MNEEVFKWAKEGRTNKEIYTQLGIGHTSFYDWVKDLTKAEFSDAIKQGKDAFKRGRVASLITSAFVRATGYDVQEPSEERAVGRDGTRRTTKELIRTKHIPADPRLLVFLLTNLAPEMFKDVQRIESKEITKEEEKRVYPFEDIDEELLFKLADQLQDAQAKREAKDVR